MNTYDLNRPQVSAIDMIYCAGINVPTDELGHSVSYHVRFIRRTFVIILSAV